ncbi:MAG: hypothetical protein H6667_05240 [Ardenticatenaceae bacterium]|nr:hypothetical protein [Ardenticatenaceae bacterium]
MQSQIGVVVVVDEDTAVDGIKTAQQVDDEGGLAAARWPDQAIVSPV